MNPNINTNSSFISSAVIPLQTENIIQNTQPVNNNLSQLSTSLTSAQSAPSACRLSIVERRINSGAPRLQLNIGAAQYFGQLTVRAHYQTVQASDQTCPRYVSRRDQIGANGPFTEFANNIDNSDATSKDQVAELATKKRRYI